jgi:hypothetical protein
MSFGTSGIDSVRLSPRALAEAVQTRCPDACVVGRTIAAKSGMSNGRNFEMWRSDRYECTLCGAIVDVPADTKPEVTAAGSESTMRVLSVDGKETHRCRKTTPSGDQFLWSVDERRGISDGPMG